MTRRPLILNPDSIISESITEFDLRHNNNIRHLTHGTPKMKLICARWLRLMLIHNPAFMGTEHLALTFLASYVWGSDIIAQSNSEQTHSLDFFDQLLLQNSGLKFSPRIAEMILRFSIIYGNNHQRKMKSIRQVSLRRRTELMSTYLHRIFFELFARYDNVIENHFSITSCPYQEIQDALLMLQGASAYDLINGAYMKVTRGESHTFYQLLTSNKSHKHTIRLRDLIVKAKFLGKINDENQVDQFLDKINRRRFTDALFYGNLEYWIKVFVFASKMKMLTTDEDEVEIHLEDFLDFLRLNFDPINPPKLKWKSITGLRNAMDRWVGRSLIKGYEEKMKDKWKNDKRSETLVHHDGSTFMISRLVTGQELRKESVTMKHCVISYIQACINDHYRVYKLKEKGGGSRLTIGIRKKVFDPGFVLEEVKGPSNRSATILETKVVHKWADIMGITKDTSLACDNIGDTTLFEYN